MGQGESRAENEAQRTGDVGTAAQSAGQQGLHLAEAHRSDEKTSVFTFHMFLLSDQTNLIYFPAATGLLVGAV